MTMLCIAMFLFSYVNSSMFWHGHSSRGYWSFHSHIADKAHRTGHGDGGHSANQFLLIEALNNVSFTEAAVPSFDLEPFRTFSACIFTQQKTLPSNCVVSLVTLRGPPELV